MKDIVTIFQKIKSSILPEKLPTKKSNDIPDFAFDEVNAEGQKLLKILTDVKLSGVTKTKDGIDPQKIIPTLKKNQKLILEHINSPYDANAVSVSTDTGKFIGWLPAKFQYKDDIAQRLDDGTPVLAVVSKVIGGDNKKSYGCLINIARYEKKRAKKETVQTID